MREFRPYARRERALYAWAFVGSLFRFLIPLSVPLVLKHIYDEVLGNASLTAAAQWAELLTIAGIMLGVFFLVRMPMEYVRQSCMHKANHNVIKALRTDAFRKVHELDASYLSEHKSGEIGTRLFDDVEKVRGYMTAVYANVWIEIIVLGAVTALMLSMNPGLTLLATALVAGQFLLAHRLAKRFKQSTADMMRYRSVLSGFMLEKIQGAFVTKLFASERRDMEELDAHLKRYEALTDRQTRLNATMLAAVNTLSDLTPFAVVAVGSMQVIEGSLTIGSLLAFFAYVDRMRSPVAALVQAMPAIAEGRAALERIFGFMDVKAAVVERADAAELRSLVSGIRFERVSFGYDTGSGREPVIRELSLTLAKGRTYAFVGESGGGKSTILRLLLRTYDATDGAVLVDGADIRDYSLASLRRHMGVVTQDSYLFSSSIRENIRLAKLDATDEEVEAAARKAYAHDFVMGLPDGYDSEIGERGVKLSGGQRQRIALARVFLKDPSIILLDEATSALDNESEKLVQASIEEAGQGKTVIMVAHRLSTVVHADTIFVLRGGIVTESGSHAELLRKSGYYRELYAEQSGELTDEAPGRSYGTDRVVV